MKKVTASTLVSLIMLMVPMASHALQVKFYQATMAQVDVASPPAAFATLDPSR